MTPIRPSFRLMIGVALLASVTEGVVAGSPASGRLSSADRAACRAQHGKVVRGGLLNLEGCVTRFKDGGRVCTDPSQCKGVCEYHGSWPPKPGKAVGQCAISSNPFGCRSIIVGGHLSQPMCVD